MWLATDPVLQTWEAAVQQLPGTIQRHLERLARAVPEDFDTSPEHVGEAT